MFKFSLLFGFQSKFDICQNMFLNLNCSEILLLNYLITSYLFHIFDYRLSIRGLVSTKSWVCYILLTVFYQLKVYGVLMIFLKIFELVAVVRSNLEFLV